jgi:RNA polymerase sigma factor (sigma-70 family)
MQTAPMTDEQKQAKPAKTDAELLLDSEPGDRQAFGTLFDRHSRAVYATAFAVVQDAADAEELLSDAFLLLWRKRASIELFGDSVVPWLITTVRYLAKNKRRTTRFSAVPLDDEIATNRMPSVERAVELRLLSQQLDVLIEGLTPIDRQIVRLCLVDGLSYEQAAERLGVTHATVRNRLSRSKKQLRVSLDPEGQNR